MSATCRRFRCGDLAFRMKSALAANRGNNDRGFPFHAKDLRRCIESVDIYEAPRPNLKLGESGVIRMKGDIVIDARCHVCPMRRWKLLPRERLEIENVNGLLGRRNELLNCSLVGTRSGRFLKSRRDYILERARRKPESQQRAPGEEFQEP